MPPFPSPRELPRAPGGAAAGLSGVPLLLAGGVGAVPIGLLLVGAVTGYLVYRAVRALRAWADGARPRARPGTTAPAAGPLSASEGGRRFGWRFLAAFAVVVAPLLYVHATVLRWAGSVVAAVGRALFWPGPWPGFVPKAVRDGFLSDLILLVYLAFLAAFVVASGLYTDPRYSAGARRRAALLVLAYVGVELALDAFFFTVPGRFIASSFLLLRAINGGVFFALVVLSTAIAPPPVAVAPSRPRDPRALPTLLVTGGIALALSVFLLYLLFRYAGLGRAVLPVAVLLLLPLSALTIWVALGRVVYDLNLITHPLPTLGSFHPPVSVLVPAYNEEGNIADCLAALDAAAALYPGTTEIVVANDGSADATSERARDAIARLAHARGRLLDLPHGGKAHALNAALAVAQGRVVLRLDADARVSAETGFSGLVPHLADPDVGGVQGMILPRQRDGWTRQLRLLEVTWNHLYLRRAMMAVRCAEVVDGVFSAFRREDLAGLGGWVPWNGEDTEVTLRLERQGYRMRLETGAVAYEDVPADYAGLRRQRLRWNRGSLFAHRRHAGAVTGPAIEFGGLALLLWFLMFSRAGLRTFVWVYAAAATLLLGLPTLFHVAAIAGLLLLPRGVAVAYYLAKVDRLRALPWLVLWPALAVVKQNFSLQSLGTLLPGSAPEVFE